MAKKKALKRQLIDQKTRIDFLCTMCDAYAKELETMMTFIKKSHLRYEEYCRFQMEEFEKDNEVEA